MPLTPVLDKALATCRAGSPDSAGGRSANAVLLMEALPTVRAIRTWNAAPNAHLLASTERLAIGWTATAASGRSRSR